MKRKELNAEALESIVGGASEKEILDFINTELTAVPESTRKKISDKLIESGNAGALKMAIFCLKDEYPKSLELLRNFMAPNVEH